MARERAPAPTPAHAARQGRAPPANPRAAQAQVVNDVPQPQEDFAFGLLNLKPEPVMAET
jgi:hypothetical protein